MEKNQIFVLSLQKMKFNSRNTSQITVLAYRNTGL